MAGFMDILGTMVQQGMSQSSGSRMSNALGAGKAGGSLQDIIASLSKALDGTALSTQGGGILGELSEVLGTLGNNKAALGGLGALAGAILSGGKSSARGAVGGGGLAMLASLAFSALKKAGLTPQQIPKALFEPQTDEEKQALEADAEIIVKAMINAAKADGEIDEAEIQKIVGKLSQDGLTDKEKAFFQEEAGKPMDIDYVVKSAGGRPEMAAQIYAASLLAIEVDTPAEKQYMQQLASKLGLDQTVTGHIENVLGV